MSKIGKLGKVLLISAGTLSLFAGVIGVFLPILPTTPFLLLAAMCYIRSSQRLYKALLGNRLVGSYIGNYLEGRGMTDKAKTTILILLWVVIIVTLGMIISSLIVRLLLLLVSTGVTIHILMLRRLKKDGETKSVNEVNSLIEG